MRHCAHSLPSYLPAPVDKTPEGKLDLLIAKIKNVIIQFVVHVLGQEVSEFRALILIPRPGVGATATGQ